MMDADMGSIETLGALRILVEAPADAPEWEFIKPQKS